MARAKRNASSSNNSANIGFEAKLWLAADKLLSDSPGSARDSRAGIGDPADSSGDDTTRRYRSKDILGGRRLYDRRLRPWRYVRFPADFVFQLTAEESEALRSQIATSSPQKLDQEEDVLRSQIATSSSHGGRRFRPYAFTEHGAIMAANVLNSTRAVQMSVFVVRAFFKNARVAG